MFSSSVNVAQSLKMRNKQGQIKSRESRECARRFFSSFWTWPVFPFPPRDAMATCMASTVSGSGQIAIVAGRSTGRREEKEASTIWLPWAPFSQTLFLRSAQPFPFPASLRAVKNFLPLHLSSSGRGGGQGPCTRPSRSCQKAVRVPTEPCQTHLNEKRRKGGFGVTYSIMCVCAYFTVTFAAPVSPAVGARGS